MSWDAKYSYEEIQKHLIGSKITRAVFESPTEEVYRGYVGPAGLDDIQYFGFEVETPNGETLTVWISSDAEMNGSGWIDIVADKEE